MRGSKVKRLRKEFRKLAAEQKLNKTDFTWAWRKFKKEAH